MAISFQGSATASSTNGLSVNLTLPSSAIAVGNWVVVTSVVTRTGSAQAVASSSGIAYTQIVAPVGSTAATASISVWQRTIASTGEVTVTCSGTGNGQDVTLAAAYIFQDSNGSAFTATSNSTTGSGTTPDSPSVIASNSSDIIISAFGAGISDTAVTAPSSYLNAISTVGADTRSGTVAAAWVTAGASGAFNPTAWSGLTSASWVAVTVGITANSPFTWFAPSHPEMPVGYSHVDIVGY